MYAMRIQQELAAQGFEFPRPRSPQSRAAADEDEVRRFIERSLAWERRLADLRARHAAATTPAGGAAVTTTPVTRPAPVLRPGGQCRPAAPVLT